MIAHVDPNSLLVSTCGVVLASSVLVSGWRSIAIPRSVVESLATSLVHVPPLRELVNTTLSD